MPGVGLLETVYVCLTSYTFINISSNLRCISKKFCAFDCVGRRWESSDDPVILIRVRRPAIVFFSCHL